MSRAIRLPVVLDITGLSRNSIYLRMSKGEFPQSISLGGRAVAWVEEDVTAWLEDRISASKSGGE